MNWEYPDDEWVVSVMAIYPVRYQPYCGTQDGLGPVFRTLDEAQAWCDEQNVENFVASGDEI